MNMRLDGKVALVGGGSRGLGRGTARVLAQLGADVALYARSAGPLEQAAAELAEETGRRVIAVPTDARDPKACADAVQTTVDQLGKLDILVPNLVGSEVRFDVVASTDEDWLEDFQLYALSVIRMARAAVPHMEQAGGGSIVNISSCGVRGVLPEFALSEVVRLATSGFAKYLSLQVAAKGIRVNSVLPGWIYGEAIDGHLRSESERLGTPYDELVKETVSVIPLGRFGTAEDVGNAVAFLSSDAGSYITGTNLQLDGGWSPTPIS